MPVVLARALSCLARGAPRGVARTGQRRASCAPPAVPHLLLVLQHLLVAAMSAEEASMMVMGVRRRGPRAFARGSV